MNDNTGGNLADITSEVEMAKKLQTKKYISLSIKNINMNKESIFKKKCELDQDLEIKKISGDRDVILAKAIDALRWERNLKHKIEAFFQIIREKKFSF